MALDSQQKRMSAAGVGRHWMRAVFPVASPTAAWRQNVGASYAGVTLVSVTRVDDRTVMGRVIIAFATGDTFRLRAQRTSGSDDLQTVDEGSSITFSVTP